MIIKQYSSAVIVELVSCGNGHYELKCWNKTNSIIINMNEKDLLELKEDIELALDSEK